jgi:hypothetical protein
MTGNPLEWLGAAVTVILLAMFEVVAYFAPIILRAAEVLLLFLIYRRLPATRPPAPVFKLRRTPSGGKVAPPSARKYTCGFCPAWQGSETLAGLINHRRYKHPEEYAKTKRQNEGG